MKKTEHLSKRSIFSLVLFISLTALISGCVATAPEASSDQKREALTFSPPPAMAGLYIIRPYNFMGAAAEWTLRLDFQDFGTLDNKSYLYSKILPGKHVLRTGPVNGGWPAVTFVAKAGQSYFFIMTPSMNLSADPFTAISEEEGQKDVREFNMSGALSYKVPPSNP